MLKAIATEAPQTKLILVLVNGMAIGVPWAKANVPAIIEGLRGACFSLLCFRRLSCLIIHTYLQQRNTGAG